VKKNSSPEEQIIWSLGCILFELFKGEAPFADSSAFSDYYFNDDHNPSHLSLDASILRQRRQLNDEERQHLRSCWHCLKGLCPDVDSGIMGQDYSESRESHISEINRMLKRLLSREGPNRPSLKQVQTHAAANAVRSRIRDDEVRSPSGWG